MPYNGSGVWVKPNTTVSPAVTGTTIDSGEFNTFTDDIATALTACYTKTGESTPTANLPMGTYRHTGVGNALALTQYASADQVVDNALCYGGASAVGTDAYAITLSIPPGASLTAGQVFYFLADVANTGACTLNVNSIGATAIKLPNGNDPHNNAIIADMMVAVAFDGTNFILLNPHIDTYYQAVTPGTAEPSKALVLDASKGVAEINSIAFDGGGDQLSHYEEGTWTPVLADSSLSAGEGQTQTSSGRFTRIGNAVFFSGTISVIDLGTLTTTQGANILGLPYTSGAGNGAVSIGSAGFLNITPGQTVTGNIGNSSNHITLLLWDFSLGTTTLLISEITSSGILSFSGHYFV